MELELSVPDMKFFPSYLKALEEGFAYGSGDPFTADEIAEIKADPEAHIAETKVLFKEGVFTADDGTTWPRVPQEKIWVTQGSEFIGAVSYRHQIHEQLENYAGHVAYSIRPSARGNNYGTKAVAMLIADSDRIARNDRDYLVITADLDNYASQKVITNNGGSFIKEAFCAPMNETVQVYHIPLKR